MGSLGLAHDDDGRAPLIAEFLLQLTQQRRLSAATQKAYANDLRALLELSEGCALADIEAHQIRRMVAQLSGRGLSGRSIAHMLSAWRGLYRWLGRSHAYTVNPCAGIRAPKSPRRLPGALSPDEAQQLLDAPVADGAQEARDSAMFELFYSSGLRLAELTALDLHDAVQMQAQHEVKVTGKGSKTRVVPVGAKALAALQQWSALRPLLARVDEQALFVGARGARIAGSSVRQRLRRWALRQGIHQRVYPHLLRHSFASHVLQSSGDLRAVQEMLGHASVSTTQIYTHLDFQHLAKAYDQAHPRAKKK